MASLNCFGQVAQEATFLAYASKVGGIEAAKDEVDRAVSNVTRLFAAAHSSGSVDLERGRAQLIEMRSAVSSGSWEPLHAIIKDFLTLLRQVA